MGKVPKLDDAPSLDRQRGRGAGSGVSSVNTTAPGRASSLSPDEPRYAFLEVPAVALDREDLMYYVETLAKESIGSNMPLRFEAEVRDLLLMTANAALRQEG